MNDIDSVKDMVTTVITAYNKAPYLAEAIRSALNQTYRPHEIVVIDDGSKDNPQDVVRPFLEQIRFVTQRNLGPSGAKNRGILEAHGEFIAFLDGDDRWCPGKLDRQMPIFAKNPAIGVVYSNYVRFRGSDLFENGGASANLSRFHRGPVLDQLLLENFVPFSSAVARRSLLLDVGLLDENERVSDDYDLWLRMARVCEFEYVDDIFVEYRTGIDSICSHVQDHFEHVMKIHNRFVNAFYGGHYPRPAVLKKALAANYAARGNRFLARSQHIRALTSYCRALAHDVWNPRRYFPLVRALVPNNLAGLLKSTLRRKPAQQELPHQQKASESLGERKS